MKSFKDRLNRGVIVCDGAMGTMIYTKGVYINRCFEALNLQSPAMIREIHEAYLKAGAEILETNTYGANRLKLLPYGLESEVAAVNRKGVELAREASSGSAYVAGSVGPIGKSLDPFGPINPEEAYDAFLEQIRALVDAGADLIMLETFANLDEIKLAIKAAQAVGDIPIVAQMTLSESGSTTFGVSPETIALHLSQAGATVVGVNCSTGPKETLDALVRMRKVSDWPLSAQPNAGWPHLVEGRNLYLTTPEYMAEYAKRMIQSTGLSIIGGCCGTTPAHIKAIKSAVKMFHPGGVDLETSVIEVSESVSEQGCEPLPVETFSPLAAKLAAGQWVRSVEISPPQGTNLEKTLAAARLCMNEGIDCINIPDGPRASARMSPVALALLIQRELPNIDPIVHFCCRDRNLLAMQADLLGLFAVRLPNVLIITGDPPKLGDYPDATAVFDVDSIGLLKIVFRLNHGQDLAGKPIGSPTGLFPAVGADPGALDFDEEMRRFERKVKAGAKCVFTQPVFDLAVFERFQKAAAPFGIPLMVGILPLSSHRNAEFLHNEVPGMRIPQEIRDRMEKVGSGPKAKAEGIAIAREALAACRPLAQGAYVMPPFNNVAAALEVLR